MGNNKLSGNRGNTGGGLTLLKTCELLRGK